MKTGLGNVANDKSVNVSTRGLKDVLSVELVDASGNQITSLASGGFSVGSYDFVSLAQTSLSDIYTFKSGGSNGTLVATITIVYVDTTKNVISTVTKT